MAIVKPFRFIPTIKKQEFNPDFADYIWLNNFFSEKEVEQIRGLWNPEASKEAEVSLAGKGTSQYDIRKSQIMWIKPGVNDWIYNKLGEACQQINLNRYKFDITGFQTELQLANYEGNGFFEWHMDFGAGAISNRKLSITVQLSSPDEYEGGELQFMINQNIFTAPKEKGTAIIFPSFALHRVTPVTKGSRKSIVGWIAGPPYR
ncbi:MAG TPA: 2OG-Fe(II) oxygenase [Bacteroidia bacterium]|nr:2OG-Fe(II) oxygenase [Bacteroidia bacterium]